MSLEPDVPDDEEDETGDVPRRGAVLREFYTIEGDGVARAIPEKLFKAQRFKETMKRLREVPLYSPEPEPDAARH